jgi:hypothetical protein
MDYAGALPSTHAQILTPTDTMPVIRSQPPH